MSAALPFLAAHALFGEGAELSSNLWGGLASIGAEWPTVVALVAGVAAVVLAIALIASRRETAFAAKLARKRAESLADMIGTVRLAEEIAGIGVWHLDLGTGDQYWSAGMRRIFGIEHDEPFGEGDAETLLFANNIDLVGSVRARTEESEAYDLHFDIYGFDGEPRAICVQACNLARNDDEPGRVVAVIRDVTSQIERERELEFSRAAAVKEANRARELAETDPLTGLANRRRVMDRLDRLVMSAKERETPLALVVFDIDHFKSVNDTHGHIEGDKVLKKVARIAMAQTREGDIVGRVGGEEFVWIIPGAGEGIVRVLSERLRHAVAQGSATENVPAVTMSAGVAELAEGDTSLSLFARADSALYDAKNAGRNRVRLAA